MKRFKQFGLLLLLSLVGMSVGMALMWGVNNVSAAGEGGHEHPLIYHSGVEASCGVSGLRAYWECQECNLYYSDADGFTQIEVENESDLAMWRFIPALEHETDAAHYFAEQDSTCTKIGYRAHYECVHCGACFTDAECQNPISREEIIIDKKEHNLEHVDAVTMTCAHDGCVEHWVCRDCGKLFLRDENGFVRACTEDEVVIKAKHHSDMNHYHAYKPATCLEAGNNAYYECVDGCGKKFIDIECEHEYLDGSEIISQKVHQSDEAHHVHEKIATCEEDGHPEYWVCKNGCGQKFADADCTELIDDDTFNALMHQYEKTGHRWALVCNPENLIEAGYRYLNDQDALVTVNAKYVQTCVNPGCHEHYSCQVIPTSFASLGDNTINIGHTFETDNNRIVTCEILKIDFSDFTQTENGYDATIKIQLPSNYSEYSSYEIVNQTEKIVVNTEIKRVGRTLMLLKIHFDEEPDGDEEITWDFDWDGDGIYEQTIKVSVEL